MGGFFEVFSGERLDLPRKSKGLEPAKSKALTKSGVKTLSASLGHTSTTISTFSIGRNDYKKVKCTDGPVYVIRRIEKALLKTMMLAPKL
jgi:hypothetical protein